MERIEQEWAIASRNQRPFALMMIDIDAFKQVNDSYGHEVGDEVLKKVAALLRQSARVEDVVGRFGGEEFVAVCPGANLAMGMRLAERLRQNLALETIQMGSVSVQVTVSIGVAERDATTATVDDVMRRADTALYRAKRDGRNRVSGLAIGDSGASSAK
jgi:two-component system cell cycle response regulator